jgi:hypothetical protein
VGYCYRRPLRGLMDLGPGPELAAVRVGVGIGFS